MTGYPCHADLSIIRTQDPEFAKADHSNLSNALDHSGRVMALAKLRRPAKPFLMTLSDSS